MDSCPHCDEQTISHWRKPAASDLRPVRCPHCGGHAYVSGWAHAAAVLVGDTLFWGGILAALVLQAWWPLALVPLGWIAFIGWFYHRRALRLIGPDEIQRSRRRATFQAIVLLIALASLTLLTLTE